MANISKIRVYLESSVISYFAARPSNDLIKLARQHLTAMWWENVLPKVEPYVSVFVMQEIMDGDPSAAAERLRVSKGILVLDENPVIEQLALSYLKKINIPDPKAYDAFHIACACVHGMDFLLTWNCTHIANAMLRETIESITEAHGFKTPVICTPDELLEV